MHVARESDDPLGDVAKVVCPLQCRLRYGAGGDSPLGERVDWAGLPINLDFAFSPQQRDKVYAQHLTRMRGMQLRQRLEKGGQVCACEFAAGGGHGHPGQADSLSSP